MKFRMFIEGEGLTLETLCRLMAETGEKIKAEPHGFRVGMIYDGKQHVGSWELVRSE